MQTSSREGFLSVVTESEKRLRCPDCGRPPEAIVRFPEPVTPNYGVLPAPQIVKRASCRNGHRWYPHDVETHRPRRTTTT